MLMYPASLSTVKFIHQSLIYEDFDRCKKKGLKACLQWKVLLAYPASFRHSTQVLRNI